MHEAGNDLRAASRSCRAHREQLIRRLKEVGFSVRGFRHMSRRRTRAKKIKLIKPYATFEKISLCVERHWRSDSKFLSPGLSGAAMRRQIENVVQQITYLRSYADSQVIRNHAKGVAHGKLQQSRGYGRGDGHGADARRLRVVVEHVARHGF